MRSAISRLHKFLSCAEHTYYPESAIYSMAMLSILLTQGYNICRKYYLHFVCDDIIATRAIWDIYECIGIDLSPWVLINPNARVILPLAAVV